MSASPPGRIKPTEEDRRTRTGTLVNSIQHKSRYSWTVPETRPYNSRAHNKGCKVFPVSMQPAALSYAKIILNYRAEEL